MSRYRSPIPGRASPLNRLRRFSTPSIPPDSGQGPWVVCTWSVIEADPTMSWRSAASAPGRNSQAGDKISKERIDPAGGLALPPPVGVGTANASAAAFSAARAVLRRGGLPSVLVSLPSGLVASAGKVARSAIPAEPSAGPAKGRTIGRCHRNDLPPFPRNPVAVPLPYGPRQHIDVSFNSSEDAGNVL